MSSFSGKTESLINETRLMAPAEKPGPCWNMDYDKPCKQMTDWAEMDAFGECV